MFAGLTRRFRRSSALRGGPLRAALRALLAEDYERAEDALTGLVRDDSKDIDAYLGLATLYRRRGEIGRAIQVHQNLLLRADLGPESRVEALAGLADDLRQGGFQRRAIAAYEEVLEHDSRHVAALRGLLEVLSDAGESERALAIQNRLSRLEPPAEADAEVALLTRMADAVQSQGNVDLARKYLKRALRKDPRFTPARALLGELEALRGKNKAALAAWRQVAEVGGPGADGIYPKLASAFATQSRGDEHEAFLRKLLADRPDDSALAIALAGALEQRGQVEEATVELRRLLALDPQELDAHIALGRLLLSDNREAEASKEFGELMALLEKRQHLTPPERLE